MESVLCWPATAEHAHDLGCGGCTQGYFMRKLISFSWQLLVTNNSEALLNMVLC